MRRTFARFDVPLIVVRAAAHAGGVRVPDLLLCAAAASLERVGPEGLPETVRVAVPVVVADPGSSREGNATTSVMVDLPVTSMPDRRRLERISAIHSRQRGGGRLPAGRFVVARLSRVLPGPVHAWFARAVYGRRFLLGVVTNIPGPDAALRLLGHEIAAVYPLVPIAPRTAFAVGALGWNRRLRVSVGVVDVAGLSARGLARAMADALDALLRDLTATRPSAHGD